MFFGLIILFLLGLAFPGLSSRLGKQSGPAAALMALAGFSYLLLMSSPVIDGIPHIQEIPWIPELGFSLRLKLDGLSLLFSLIITGIGIWVFWYAGAYLENDPKRGRFIGVLLLFMASMLGVVLSDQVLALFVFWELTSFTSYLLIGHYHEQMASRRAALQALLVTIGGGLFLLAGLLIIGLHYGSFQFSDWVDHGLHGGDAPPLAGLLCVLIGAWTKSAHMPFHFWLPNAMEAPSPASAYLHSSTMVKAGVYLIMRLDPALSAHPLWSTLVMSMGALTFLACAIMALGQTDLKRLLAYTTASALGSITFMVGVGTEKAAKAAILLLVAHALYKATLFLTAGAIAHETGERDSRKLGGLMPLMPRTGLGGMLAGLSMAGIPPFFGFIAKETAYASGTSLLLLLLTLLASSAFVVVGITCGMAPYMGDQQETPRKAHEAPAAMWAGPVVLGSLGLLFGLFPKTLSPLLMAAARGIDPHLHAYTFKLWHGFNLELLLSLLTLGLGYGLWKKQAQRLRITDAVRNACVFAGPDHLYDLGLIGLVRVAKIQTRFLQNGSLRRYILFIMAFTLFLAFLCAQKFWDQIPDFSVGTFRLEDAFIVVVVLSGAIAATLLKSRLAAILSLGVVGYGVALVFIMYGAPDLAMTQFIVESLTVILIALTFYHLPPFRPRTNRREKSRDLVFASLVGLVAGSMTLLASRATFVEPISDFFMQNSWKEAHGMNVVNVILVDFRAMDTLGEITVLSVAGLGAYALLKLIIKPGEDPS